MPLRALLDETELIAPLVSDEQWEQMRARARRDRAALVMRCCGHQAQPRTSKLGLRHFAHRPGADCSISAGETIHHLTLKAEILRAAHAAGWEASPEVAEDGWRADVLATNGPERVAFEVQWSAITPEEMLARSLRYADSGVRTVWLTRRQIPWELERRADLPIFRVEHRPGVYEVRVGGQAISPADAAHAVLDGRIALAEPVCDERPTCTVSMAYAVCETCRRLALPVAAPDEPALTAVCGQPLQIGSLEQDRIEQQAIAGAVAEIRRGHVAAGELELRYPGARHLPWASVCGHCRLRTDLTLKQSRELIAEALKAGRDAQVLHRHQVTQTPSFRGHEHWCTHDKCAAAQQAAPGDSSAQRDAERLAARVGATVRQRAVPAPTGADARAVIVRRGGAAVAFSSARPGVVDARVLSARLRRAGVSLLIATSDREALRELGDDRALAVGDANDLGRLSRVLEVGGPRRSQVMRAAATQHADVWVWEERCWRCKRSYEAVAASGAWRAMCGALMGSFDLQDPVAAPAIAAALRSPFSPVRADLAYHRSKTTGTQDWVNRCPHCRAVLGRFYAFMQASHMMYEPPDHTVELSGVRPTDRNEHHWCAGPEFCASAT